jgi:predicted amidohydrolase YtcJ
MHHWLSWLFCLAVLLALGVRNTPATVDKTSQADLIIHHATVVTLDGRSRIAQALAIQDGRIIAVGENKVVLQHQGSKTQEIHAQGRLVLPGLYDSHVHPVGAATSELIEPLPNFKSLEDVFSYIRKKADQTPEGQWIVLRFVFPTRLREARFPSKTELDAAAPRHPVLFHAGPAGMVNSLALRISEITRDTPNPPAGVIVKDPRTGEPTGMLRNAYRVLRGVPPASVASAARKRQAVKELFHLYNRQGLTSIADRNADRADLDLYQSLHKAGELTLRINVARSFNPYGTREEVARRLDELPGAERLGGPTGKGGVWIRIGPIKFFLDGGMLNGTAYMRQPWPPGDTYQIVESDYRGLLFIPPEQLRMVIEEAVRRHWQVTFHTAGEGAMDELLAAYEHVNRLVPLRDLRCCITHANFPSQRNLELCQRLGVCADVQPAWLWKDGATLERVLGEKRMRWFQPYKTWLRYTTIGGGSDHMIKLDPLESTNPWSPWLGLYVAVSRHTEAGSVLLPEERLTREEALRLYTTNSAYLHHEEKEKGSLEVGKLGDVIVIDRDYLTCPVEEIPRIQVLYTIVGGKIVYERGSQ